MARTISLELNELNFHYVKSYVDNGKLRNFATLFERCDVVTTVAESGYPNLEPWIQWPTVYSGLSYQEHGIFRLGDVVNSQHKQVWEVLESQGFRVGAVSPMNAANRCEAADFFLPDPWTNTKITANERVTALFNVVSSVVNSNATEPVSFIKVGRKLLPLALPFISIKSLPQYVRILLKAIRYNWAKAAFLDRLLADLFVGLVVKNDTEFASLFLNAGAHIQHHHTYDSAAYSGKRSNPTWYSPAAGRGVDPLLFIYDTYDAILGEILALEDTRVILITGLSQIPNERDHYQYRPIDFNRFLGLVDVRNGKCEARMSRDFLLSFDGRDSAELAIKSLALVSVAGRPFFSVEDRGTSLFCQVSYFGPPDGLRSIDVGGKKVDFSSELALVSIENAIHQTTGYFVDSGVSRGTLPAEIPLTGVFSRLLEAAADMRIKSRALA